MYPSEHAADGVAVRGAPVLSCSHTQTRVHTLRDAQSSHGLASTQHAVVRSTWVSNCSGLATGPQLLLSTGGVAGT